MSFKIMLKHVPEDRMSTAKDIAELDAIIYNWIGHGWVHGQWG
jgi:hypothetical protein